MPTYDAASIINASRGTATVQGSAVRDLGQYSKFAAPTLAWLIGDVASWYSVTIAAYTTENAPNENCSLFMNGYLQRIAVVDASAPYGSFALATSGSPIFVKPTDALTIKAGYSGAAGPAFWIATVTLDAVEAPPPSGICIDGITFRAFTDF